MVCILNPVEASREAERVRTREGGRVGFMAREFYLKKFIENTAMYTRGDINGLGKDELTGGGRVMMM